MSSDEGVVRFRSIRAAAPPPDGAQAVALCGVRNHLYRLGLIGALPDGTGYGNASVRSPHGVLITGTGTGGIEHLLPEHITCIERCAIDANTVWCSGPVDASSETMTHMGAYAASSGIGAVVHGHHTGAWRRLCGAIPTTDSSIPYGTPQMARAVEDLVRRHYQGAGLLLAMQGHEGGVLAVGGTLDEAVAALVDGTMGGRA